MRSLSIGPRRRQWLQGTAALCAGGLVQAQTPAAPRIVCVGGALTETIFALGAQDRLVGVDTTSLFPAEAQRLPSVGYARTLSAEGVMSLRPTLVVATPEAGPPAVLRQLEAARIPLALLDTAHGFDSLLARTTRLAALCGQERAGTAMAAQLQADWARTTAMVRTLAARRTAPPRVLFVLAHGLNALRVSGHGTAADAMIRHAGATNVLAAVEGYKPLTPEAAIAAAPDVILATDQGLQAAGGVDGLLRSPGLAQTPAGQARRVVSLEALFLLGFGPRLPQAVAALAQALHGRVA